jgi:hypothetical protein
MNAHTAEIASRTKTKQSDTKIPSISAVILGPALLWQDTRPSFTPLQIGPMQILADIAVRIFLAVVSRHQHLVTDRKFPSQPTKTGKCESFICRKCINLENAITRRSSFERIISDSI